MIQTIKNYIFKREYNEFAEIPVINSNSHKIHISTRNKNLVVYWGDNSLSSLTPSKNIDATLGGLNAAGSHGYSTPFTDVIKVRPLGGLKDVYSIIPFQFFDQADKNIQDYGKWIKQYTNLYSIYIVARYDGVTPPIVKGNLLHFSDTVERVRIEATQFRNPTTDIVLDFSSISTTSNLKWLYKSNTGYGDTLRVIGDISKAPTTLSFVDITARAVGSNLTYSTGKTWASSFDTFTTNITMPSADSGRMINEMNTSIVTAIGGKLIRVSSLCPNIIDYEELVTKGFNDSENLISLTNKAFIFTIDTTLHTINNKTIQLIVSGLARIDWGDGNWGVVLNQSNANVTYEYAVKGIYTIKIYSNKTNTVCSVGFNTTYAKCLKTVDDVGNVLFNFDMFRTCLNLTSVSRGLNIEKISTNLGIIFHTCPKFNQSLNYWNVSNVTSMSGMFQNATLFNGDISSWDVSKVTNMANMFYGGAAFNQDITNWNVSNVTSMSGMFQNAFSFNQDISLWTFNKNVTLNNFMSNNGGMYFSSTNYDKLLDKWVACFIGTGRTQTNKVIDMGRIRYTIAGKYSHDLLVANGWTIYDNGMI